MPKDGNRFLMRCLTTQFFLSCKATLIHKADKNLFGFVVFTLLGSPQSPDILSAFSPEQIHETYLKMGDVFVAIKMSL